MTHRALALAFGSLLVGGAVCAAPPDNDEVSTARVLDSDTPDTSTTVEATLASGEAIPIGYSSTTYHGTVWWEWSPVFSGWHEINTTDSTINTVLTVWTDNNGTGPLTLVHVNDEATEDSVSRVWINADASIVYKIAVASRTSTRGDVTINAFFIPTPFARVTAAAFTPSTVEVGTTAATITADVTIQSSGEFSAGSVIKLYEPTSNTVIAAATVGAANRTSGVVANGIYRMTLTLPKDSVAGTYRWGIFVNRQSSADTSAYGFEGMTPLPSGAPTSITVTHRPPDPFVTWAGANGLIGADALRTADPDHDDLTNLEEYVDGLSPQSGSNAVLSISSNTITQLGLPLITVIDTGDQSRLRVVYLRRLGDPSISYAVEYSDDLAGWTNATQAGTVIATTGGFEAVQVDDDVFIPAKDRRFARVTYMYTP